MAQVRFDTESRKREFPYCEAGMHGSGHEHEADCEIQDYAALCTVGDRNTPPWDRNLDQDRAYGYIKIQVRPVEGPIAYAEAWPEVGPGSGNRLWKWLENIGVPVAEDGSHDDEAPIGMKCAIECGTPYVGKDGAKNTVLKNIFAAG
jgi:hypothetical protein